MRELTLILFFRRHKMHTFIIRARDEFFVRLVIYPTEIVRQLMALCLLIYTLQYSVARKVEIIIPLLFL